MAGIHFEEQERMPIWIWIVVAPVAILMWVAFITQIILEHPFGSKPAPNAALWVLWLLIGIGFPVFYASLKSTIVIDAEGIKLRFFPFFRKRIALGDVAKVTLFTGNPIFAFGGWGLRWDGRKTAIITRGGKQGVEITTAMGRFTLLAFAGWMSSFGR